MSTKQRAARNQTITLADEERNLFAKKLFVPEKAVLLSIEQVKNKTILLIGCQKNQPI